MLPKHKMLPNCNYNANKILRMIGLKFKMLHACPNNFVLYRYKFATLRMCPTYGLQHLKKKLNRRIGDEEIKGLPAKVLWYLKVISRFK